MTIDLTNWAGNIQFRARAALTPQTMDELRRIVASERSIRVIGSLHSFTDIADTDGVLISLEALTRADDVVVAPDRATVRVPAGIRYGDLVPTLEREGLALRNLASLPHISVAGAVQTGTHGSGDRTGSLATQVAALELVTASGDLATVARGDEDFAGYVVGLGALGVVTHVHLDAEPAYDVAQTVYEGVTWDAALADFDTLTSAGDSVSLFTRWADADHIDQVWVKARVGNARGDVARLGGIPADGPRHPLPAARRSPHCARWRNRSPRCCWSARCGRSLPTTCGFQSAPALGQGLHHARRRHRPPLPRVGALRRATAQTRPRRPVHERVPRPGRVGLTGLRQLLLRC